MEHLHAALINDSNNNIGFSLSSLALLFLMT